MELSNSLIYSFFISDYCELVFQKTQVGGTSFGNIRQFIHSRKYTGPTTKGLLLKKSLLIDIVKNLKNKEDHIKRAREEKEVARLPYKKNNFIIISLRESTVDDNPVCLDLREFIMTPKYTGFTKKGIRFSINQLDEFIKGCELLISKISD
jgi:hypothetical protein